MAAGGLLIAVGVVVLVASSAQLGPALTPYPRPRERGEVVERGLYARVRHPIYGAAVLIAAGWSLAFASVVGGVLTAVLALFLDLKSRREEQWLARRYPGYAAYRERVRARFVPRVY